MTARSIISGLTMMVLALLAGLGYLLTRDPVVSSRPRVENIFVTNTFTRVGFKKVNTTNYLYFPSGFSWASMESTNYPSYIENLRSIGCPEETIRDIVVADVAKLYSQKRSQVWAAAEGVPYWKAGDALNAQLRQALRGIEEEQKTLIRQLLGIDLDSHLERFSSEPPARPLDLLFLAADKQARVRDVLERHRRGQQEFRDRAGSLWTDVDSQQLRGLRDQEDAELRSVLTPQEFDEYQLRQSDLSLELREQLQGLNVSEDEFRKIFQARRAFSEAERVSETDTTGADADQTAVHRAQAEDRMNSDLLAALGADRLQRYQRAQEPSYQTLSKLTERLNLGGNVAESAYDYLRVAQDRMEVLLNDGSVESETRETALRALSDEASAGLRTILGPEAFNLFLGSGGRDWLNPQ